MPRSCLTGFVLWVACGLQVSGAERPAAGDAIFTNTTVREIHLSVDAEGLKELRRDTREYVRATWREGGSVFTNVGIHLKGMGSFRPVDKKPALTVKFNKFVEDQNYHGLTKVSLNNAVQDPSYLNEMICTELFREAGVPAARVAHARVHLNDRYLGLYTLVEGLNKPFLRRHFSDGKGNLYEGHTKDVSEYLDHDNGEDVSQKDLKALVEAAGAGTAERWSRIGEMVDLQRFISMMAGEVLMAHWDGYWLNRNNYCVYHDARTKKMTFIPHGLDNMFQLTTMPWRPTSQGLIVRAVLRTPEGQRCYRERISHMLTNSFKADRLTNRIDELAARIRPVLQGDSERALKEFEESVADFKRRVVARIENVTSQLAALGTLAKFDAAGVASGSGWNWSTNVDAGVFIMSRGMEEKRPVLKIKHGDTIGTLASWRTRIGLDAGQYRFRCKVKAQGLTPLDSPNTGVSLRISGMHPPFQIVRDTDWRQVEFDFDVLPPGDDVDLVCQLSTVLGEAWFDLSSLQVVRLRADRSVADTRHPIK